MLNRDEAYNNYLMVKEAGVMQTLKSIPSRLGNMFKRTKQGVQEYRTFLGSKAGPSGAPSLGAAAPASSAGRKGLSLSDVAKQSQNRQAMINKYRGGGQADSQLIGIKDGVKDGGKITRVFK